MRTSIVWFRTDLRTEDNLSLQAALAASEQVLPVFIWDPKRPTYGSINRLRFMTESLTELEEELLRRGSKLIIRRGDPSEELLHLARETGAEHLFFGRHYEPYELSRDALVCKRLAEAGIGVTTLQESVLFELGDVLNKEGKPYTIYTPFKNAAWPRLAGIPRPKRLPAHLKPPAALALLHSDDLRSLASHAEPSSEIQNGGMSHAEKLWQRFRSTGLSRYTIDRDHLGATGGTSRLSPHLKFGTISIRRVLREALELVEAGNGAETFIRELLWREFYSNILQAFPHVVHGPFHREFAAIEWSDNEAHFASWCEGMTGVPIVDAAMRELLATGYMHNRARMIVASFLVKDLRVNWQLGELHFMKHLVDGDLAQNNGGWQWAASTGTDAQPYYRIFNPYLQSKKFDPEGSYIKRFVPELRTLPSTLIHEPHLLTPMAQREYGVVIGEHYPRPIIDHATAREKAKQMYQAVAKLRIVGQ